MSKAIAGYAGGVHGRIDAAVRADGVLFKRYQSKGARGYVWSAWTAVGKVDVECLPAYVDSGFSKLYPANEHYSGWRKWRLPN